VGVGSGGGPQQIAIASSWSPGVGLLAGHAPGIHLPSPLYAPEHPLLPPQLATIVAATISRIGATTSHLIDRNIKP
ncbi:MAG TPA: hypothetical protein VEC38_09255, partial [Candidatus Binataceae bacterium]|nr:hypothetical protein [Candidatus Binataceae bacterium]